MMESSENTMSMMMICTMMAAKLAFTPFEAWPSSPSVSWWISMVDFHTRNRPPAMRMRSRPEMSVPMTVNSGAVSPTIHDSTSSRPMRMNIARNRPMRRAFSRCTRSQLVDQDGDENDVVDAEHQLERRQREKSDPYLRIGQEGDDGFHGWPPY